MEPFGDDRGAHAEGTARYIIDCLNAEQTASIARAILADADLASQIDLKLPELNGYDVCTALRAHPPRAHLKIIMMSGYADPDERATALEHGLTVVTRNVSDFERSGVAVLDPFSRRANRKS